ncbi:MAG: efflux RND transporter permease subunit [Bacteriovoracaceae bacterium]|nr:efflux RND transporter permease subunit [Bacteriovoracaceae bacterium]
MKNLIRYFIERSFLVNLLSAFIIIMGIIALSNMKRDLVPQWKINRINITSSLSGASPGQVENFVTFPIEEAIQSFAGIEELTSQSREGSSSITVKVKTELSENEINDLYQNILAAVNNIKSELPQDIENLQVVNEKLTSFWFSSLSVLNFDNFNPLHRRWLKDVRDELRKVPGIVQVTDRASKADILIKFNQTAMARYRLTSADIQTVLAKKFRPLPVGSIDRGESSIAVQISHSVESLESLKNLIVKGNGSGTLIRLKDIARVTFEIPKQKSKQFTNGQASVSIVLFKDLETDTLDTKVEVEKVLLKINELTPEGIKVQITDDGPSYIERQLNVLKSNALMGVILVVLVLLAFLGLKTSLMTTFGLPLAYFATFIVLGAMGMKIDIISVVGMILILGILVDDAIIVSEQYMQYLELGHPPKEAAMMAVRKTFVPIIGTVLTTAVAFSPILLANDGLSEFLGAIPWVVFAALGMSLIESFFVLPNHLAHFVKKPIKYKEGGLFERFKGGYERGLNFCLKWRYPLVLLFVVFSGWTFYFASQHVPFKFNLRIGSEKIRVIAELKESATLAQTEKELKPLWDLLAKIDTKEYSHIEGNLGWAYISGEEYNGDRFANVAIRFNQTHPDIDGAKERINSFLEKNLPLLKTDNFKRLETVIEKSGHEKAKDHTVSIKVRGKGQVNLEEILLEVEKTAKTVKETKSVYVDPKLIVETWDFEIDDDSLINYDIEASDVSTQLRQFVTKNKIREVRFKGESVKVLSFFEEGDALTYEGLSELKVLGKMGRLIPLNRLGVWVKKKSLRSLDHKDLSRNYEVDVRYDEKLIKKEIFIKKLKELMIPLNDKFVGHKFVVEDADEEAKKNKSSISKMAIFCVLFILLVLSLVLNSLFQPLLIGAAIPFGVVGVIWAFYFHGIDIDVMAIVGIIGMAGVVVNDSLIMVDTINGLTEMKRRFNRSVIVLGAVTRLRPILLTSITTLGGVFPMAYGLGGDSGFTKPLALSMGWGLFLATFLTLFLIPAMLNIQADVLVLGEKFMKRFKRNPKISKKIRDSDSQKTTSLQ